MDFPEGTLRIDVSDWVAAEGRSAHDFLRANPRRASLGAAIASAASTVAKMDDRDGAYTVRGVDPPSAGRFSLLMVCRSGDAIRAVDFQGPMALFTPEAEAPWRFMRGTMEEACDEPVPSSVRSAKGPDHVAEVLGQVDRLWHVGQLVPSLEGYRASRHAVLALRDGWATTRVDEALQSGAEASRREHPGSWGRWRLNGKGELSVRWGGDEDYRDFYYAFGVEPLGRVRGCFSETSASDLSGIGETNVAVSVNTWCFAPDGRFTNDRALGLSYGDGAVDASGSSASATSGRYATDGYLLTLTYGDGRVIRTLAGVSREGAGERDLVIGGSRFGETR